MENKKLVETYIELCAKLDDFGKHIFNRLLNERIPNPSYHCNPIVNKHVHGFSFLSKGNERGHNDIYDNTIIEIEDNQIIIQYEKYLGCGQYDVNHIYIPVEVFENEEIDLYLDNWAKESAEYRAKLDEELKKSLKECHEKAAIEKEERERKEYERLKAKFEKL